LRFNQNWPAGYNNGFLKLGLLIFEAEQSLPEGRSICSVGNRNDDAFYFLLELTSFLSVCELAVLSH
jgi:hypothetical protein